MHRIYQDAKDVNVAITMAYSTATGDYLYSDVKRQRKLTKDEVVDLCMKGVAIELPDSEFLSPIHLKNSGDGIVVTCYDGTKALTFKSAEVE